MEQTAAEPPVLPFVQPKSWIRWVALLLAAGGVYVSVQSCRVSAGAIVADPLMQAVCGGSPGEGTGDNCTSVLTAPQAYVRVSSHPGVPRIPVSAFSFGFYAFLGLWYLFVGPPTHSRRVWHLIVLLFVLIGAWQSVIYIGIMKYELHRWCGICLAAHAINGLLLLLTILAWPWREPKEPTQPHPSARLALATVAAGLLAMIVPLGYVFVNVAGGMLRQRTAEYQAILDDPEYILWDYARRPVQSLPFYEDEVFAGPPAAPHTLVVFSDFQCTHCRQLHEMIDTLLEKYAGRLRVAYRYYPQDSACNPHPNFRAGGHASGCRAARAAEAARIVGGPRACLLMRKTLYERQSRLPTKPVERQSEQQRELFADWAAELGLDRAAFVEAFDSPAVAARIQADIQAAKQLGIHAMPVPYLDGRRLRNWTKLETWAVLLRGEPTPATQLTSAPAAP